MDFYITVGMGDRFRSMGAGGPVVVFLISYVAIQIATFLGLLAIPLALTMGESSLRVVGFNFLRAATQNQQHIEVMPLGMVPVLVAVAMVYAVWTARSVERRTSLR